MRVSVVSDIHGNFDGLARVADTGESLLVLGDFLEYVDYFDPSAGILGEIFGTDAVEEFIQLRTKGEFEALHAYDRHLWASLDNPNAVLAEVVASHYRRALDVLSPSTLVMLGNVDMRDAWDAIAPPHQRCLDGTTVVIDGLTFGFVAGGCVKEPPTGSPWASFDRTPNEYRQAVGRVGDVDVLCSHLPPDIHELRYDKMAKRREMFGAGLLELIDDQQPLLALSGHVHHPLRRAVARGRTNCVNVGYFKRRPRPYVIDTDVLRP